MENIYWDPIKNEKLKIERDVSFEEILVCIKNQQLLAIIENPSRKYKNQKIFVIELNNYVYYVPFAETEDGIFLKTIIPSRKLTREYLRREGDKDA